MQVVASRGELPQTTAEEWFLSLSSFMCHHGFYDAAFSHMCDLFPRLCSEFPAGAISAFHGAANTAKRDKETFGFLRSSVQHISKTTAASWTRQVGMEQSWSSEGFSSTWLEKIVMFFQLALCECPEMPWSSELWVHCITEPPCVNAVLLRAAPHKVQIPASTEKWQNLCGCLWRWSLMSHRKITNSPPNPCLLLCPKIK